MKSTIDYRLLVNDSYKLVVHDIQQTMSTQSVLILYRLMLSCEKFIEIENQKPSNKISKMRAELDGLIHNNNPSFVKDLLMTPRDVFLSSSSLLKRNSKELISGYDTDLHRSKARREQPEFGYLQSWVEDVNALYLLDKSNFASYTKNISYRLDSLMAYFLEKLQQDSQLDLSFAHGVCGTLSVIVNYYPLLTIDTSIYSEFLRKLIEYLRVKVVINENVPSWNNAALLAHHPELMASTWCHGSYPIISTVARLCSKLNICMPESMMFYFQHLNVFKPLSPYKSNLGLCHGLGSCLILSEFSPSLLRNQNLNSFATTIYDDLHNLATNTNFAESDLLLDGPEGTLLELMLNAIHSPVLANYFGIINY